MKYIAVIGVFMCLNMLNGAIDPDTYEDIRHNQANQIVKFNKNTKGNKRYYGREGVLRLPLKKVVR